MSSAGIGMSKKQSAIRLGRKREGYESNRNPISVLYTVEESSATVES